MSRDAQPIVRLGRTLHVRPELLDCLARSRMKRAGPARMEPRSNAPSSLRCRSCQDIPKTQSMMSPCSSCSDACARSNEHRATRLPRPAPLGRWSRPRGRPLSRADLVVAFGHEGRASGRIPGLNLAALKALPSAGGMRPFDEAIQLSHELGLSGEPADVPGFDELILRLHQPASILALEGTARSVSAPT